MRKHKVNKRLYEYYPAVLLFVACRIMKRPCIIVLFLIVSLPLLAQERPEVWEVIDSLPRIQVPKSVILAFKIKYPSINPLFWFQLNDDYEAQFVINEHSVSAEFSKAGKWINTETVLPEEEFNDRIISYVRSYYPKYELDMVILEESPVGKFFDVTIINEDLDLELIFDENGFFLRKAETLE